MNIQPQQLGVSYTEKYLASTRNYILIVFLFTLLSSLSAIVGEPKVIVTLHVYFLFSTILLYSQLFRGLYLYKIIILTLIYRISLYLHTINNETFIWKNSIFFSDDTDWYQPIIMLMLDSLNNGSIPLNYFLETFGSGNGTIYSFTVAILFFVLNIDDFYVGIIYLPLYHFFLFVILLIYLNKLVLSFTQSRSYAVIALSILAFSPQHYFWNFVAIKESFLAVLLILFTFSTFKYLSSKKIRYIIICIIISILLYIDRKYFGIFSFLTILSTWIYTRGSNSFFRGLISLKTILVIILLLVLFHEWMFSNIHDLYYAVTVGNIVGGGILAELDLLKNPILGFIRFLITPICFRPSLSNSINIISQYSCFFQIPLMILSLIGLLLLVKKAPSYIFLVFPLFFLFPIFSVYAPGMDRIRDNFLYLFAFLACLSFNPIRIGIVNLIKLLIYRLKMFIYNLRIITSKLNL